MSPAELVAELQLRNVRLSRVGGRLQVAAPKGILTDDQRQGIAMHRTSILALLCKAESERAMSLIHERGYVPIESATLHGEIVLFIRDESVEIPNRWQDAVTYTLAELAELRKAGRDALPAIHDIKSAFRGRILKTTDTFECAHTGDTDHATDQEPTCTH